MKNSKSADVLADPEIQRHTERILALREEERQTREQLGGIIAAIGTELIAVKEALDRLSDKTAWLRWLKDHVHDSADTAQRYMRVARFSQKNRNVAVFFDLDPSVLYRVSALSDQMTEIRGRKGSLTGDSKQRVLAVIESLRRIVLKWPAWATPATKKKPTR